MTTLLDTTPADVVNELQRKWTALFNQRDIEGLVALYAREACLFGGKPDLSFTLSGVRAYFNALPPFGIRAEFGKHTVVKLAPTVIMSAGFITFGRADASPSEAPSPYRISLTVVEEDGVWKIASHHASPVPA